MAAFAESVAGDELLSIAVPLVSVMNEEALLSLVLAPILAFEYSTIAVTVPSGSTGVLEPTT